MKRRTQRVVLMTVLVIVIGTLTVMAQEVTPEVTPETTPEATLTATAEATLEVTPETTSEMTDEPPGQPTAMVTATGTTTATPVPEPDATDEGLANTLDGAAVITETLPFETAMLDRLQLPEGFEVNVFAQGLGNARWMAIAPDGTVFRTRRAEGDVIALTDQDVDGVADMPQVNVVVSDLPFVHGITFNGSQVYLVTETQIYLADWLGGPALSQLRLLVSDLPAGGQHPNRTVAVGPDNMLYVTIGSTCNACAEPNPENATILHMRLDGTGREIFASGLRNTIGFGWHPVSGELWGMDHGSDWRGNDQPPEELNRLHHGENYGWPFCFSDQQPDLFIPAPPPGGSGRAAYCQRTTGPVLEYTAHSAPIGMVYYNADQFPDEYRGDAFIAMRGSWNRNPPTGYKVVRLLFDDSGQPTGFEDFLTGFLIEEQLANFGRVAGLAVAADGSLLIAEDQNGIIYRVSYNAS
ncbi:MAG: sorbosone dehydrogenase family protein [Chloroflexi bacterium]|nr:sorbosone dehydrogenase family protein [Chloroflexota bacterium]